MKAKKKVLKKTKTVQQSIPYMYVYEDGIIETRAGCFTRAYKLKDINFAIATEDEQRSMYMAFERLLNVFGADTEFQIFIQNHKADKRETLRDVHFEPNSDSLNKFRVELNNVLIDKISAGKNSIQQEKFLIVSTKDNNASAAIKKLCGLDIQINNAVGEISKDIDAPPCTREERLETLYNVYNQTEETSFGNIIYEDGTTGLDLGELVRQGLTTKDMIAPPGMVFENNMFRLGKTYGRSLFLEKIPGGLSTDFITRLSNLNIEMVISIHYTPIDSGKGRKMVKDHLKNVKGAIGAEQERAAKAGYSMDILPEDLEYNLESTRSLMDDIMNRDQNLFQVTMVITVFADTAHELDEGCRQVTSTAKGKLCDIKTLLFQQEEGLNQSLPLCLSELRISRMMTTESGAIFIPYTSQELFQKGGAYYGTNQITNNIIVANRLRGQNFNGLLFGYPGSGKSFFAKLEMIQALLRSGKNFVYVIDPQAEYGGRMREALRGEEVTLSAGSTSYLNPLDMDIGYGGDDDPIAPKCEYIIGMIEIILGTNQSLSPKEKSIISRCTEAIYRPYLRHLDDQYQRGIRNERGEKITFDREAMPTLNTLYNELKRQPEMEAQEIAGVLEMYATGAFSTFAHRSNVKTDKRYVTYNIRNLGTGMKTLGLHICLNDVWNKMIENHKKGYWTWIYIDEFWYLLQTDSSCKFLGQVWKTARKWNGVPTGITQNADDMLMYQAAKTIFDNTSFITIFNSSKNDRDALADLLQIPESQMKYVTNNPAGTGLIYTGNTVLPFNGIYPKNSMVYKIASTSQTKDADVK